MILQIKINLLINSIGLMKTKLPIIFNQYVKPYPINRRYIGGNVPVTLAGFGATDPELSVLSNLTHTMMSQKLQYMETRTITFNQCSIRAGLHNVMNIFYPWKPIIHPTSHLCTLQEKGTGLCFGKNLVMINQWLHI